MRFVITPRLPKEFIELDYIESNGTQYINTGFKPNQNTKVEIKFNQSNSEGSVIFGSRNVTGADMYEIWSRLTAGDTRFDFGSDYKAITGITLDTDHTIIKDGPYNYLDGSLVATNTSISSLTINYTMYLLCLNTGGTLEKPTSAKVYYCKIWDNNELVRNLIPAKRVSDSVIGMYDLVNSAFYENKGSGTFTAGPITHKQRLAVIPTKSNLDVPAGFKRLEYVESSGTQYIDTGVIGNGEFDVDYGIYLYSTENTFIGGTRSQTQHLNFGQYDDSNLDIAYLGSYWKGATISTNTYYNVKLSYKSGSQTITVNGTSGTGNTLTGTEQTDLSIYLFNRNYYSSESRAGISGRLYYFKLWNNGALVRNFIPAQRISDGVVGMYDSVNGVFYENAGTGVFTAGPVVTEVEYIQSSGTQYIDTGVTGSTTTEIYAEIASLKQASDGFEILFSSTPSSYIGYLIDIEGSTNELKFRSYADTMTSTGVIIDNNKHSYLLKKGSLVFDGVTYTGSQDYSGGTLGKVLLFKRDVSSSQGLAKVKCYIVKVWNNGTLVRNFIPVKVGTEYAMLDTVNNVIYRNASSTGAFTGKEKTYPKRFLACPKETYSNKYIRLEYLESNGTQYINTGVTLANNNIGTKITCSFTDMPSAMSPFGAPVYYGLNTRSSGTVVYWNGGGYPVSDGSNIVNKKYVFTLNYKGDLSFTKDGVAYKSDLPAYGFNSGTVYLFAYSPNVQPLYGRIYSCELLSGDTLIRDFIPVKRIDGVLGMYDRANSVFYENKGSGTFTAGPVVAKPF